jgi:hypothetical protein
MSTDLIKANLNLHAVLKNLEDLVRFDEECARNAAGWEISIQFKVRKGPRAYIAFSKGTCTVDRGVCKRPSIVLYFFSPGHLNRMFDGKAMPVILKGFTKLGFLTKDFDALTKKLEYYLKPTPELLAKKDYMNVNTCFTITTATFALAEIAMFDPIGKLLAGHASGTLMLSILPNGPALGLTFSHGEAVARKGKPDKPMAAMIFKDMKSANDILNSKADTFSAVVKGNLMLRGQIGMIDTVGSMLDRIPLYLS